MKKLLFAVLCAALIVHLYAQNTGLEPDPEFSENTEEEGEDQSDQTKKEFTFPRERFEVGFDVNAAFDNDLLGLGDIFSNDLVIDLNKLRSKVSNSGFNLNLGVFGGLFINVKNIEIYGGVWDFGFSSGADGNLHFNVPKSMVTFISEGNKQNSTMSGMVNASGGVFANAGLSASAKYGKLRVGAKPVLFAPLIVIPKSGINYRLETTEEMISLSTSGQIAAYGVVADVMEGENAQVNFGADISLEGEYELFSFLDVGAGFYRIPLAPAAMKNGMFITMAMDKDSLDIIGQDLLDGKGIETPDFDFEASYGARKYNVFRPLRFDVYARYKPFEEILFVVRPNMGFSVSINDKQGYFNAGAEAQIELLEGMFLFHVGTGIEELVWKQRLGFAFNVRAFELDLETVFRSQSFAGSFTGQGFGINLGLRFGW